MKRDYFAELGVRPFINAAGTYTTLTASLMAPEVMAGHRLLARNIYVHLNELHDRVGERIASLIGCEAAMVSAGAASALTLGTAACMTGTNEEFIRRLPDTTGMKTEVIIQKISPLRVRSRGAQLRHTLRRGRDARTTGERHQRQHGHDAVLQRGRLLRRRSRPRSSRELGKKHGIPTFNDAAADVPPVATFRNTSRWASTW